METDLECLIAADYCEEHGCDQAAKLLRTAEADGDQEKIDPHEYFKAVMLCMSWPVAVTKLATARLAVGARPSTKLTEHLRQWPIDYGRAVLAEQENAKLVEKLLWRRRGGQQPR